MISSEIFSDFDNSVLLQVALFLLLLTYLILEYASRPT